MGYSFGKHLEILLASPKREQMLSQKGSVVLLGYLRIVPGSVSAVCSVKKLEIFGALVQPAGRNFEADNFATFG